MTPTSAPISEERLAELIATQRRRLVQSGTYVPESVDRGILDALVLLSRRSQAQPGKIAKLCAKGIALATRRAEMTGGVDGNERHEDYLALFKQIAALTPTAPAPQGEKCTKPLPDLCDEREPVNHCKCAKCTGQQPAEAVGEAEEVAEVIKSLRHVIFECGHEHYLEPAIALLQRQQPAGKLHADIPKMLNDIEEYSSDDFARSMARQCLGLLKRQPIKPREVTK